MTRDQFRRKLEEYASCATSASDRFKSKAEEIRAELEREFFGPEVAEKAPTSGSKEKTKEIGA